MKKTNIKRLCTLSLMIALAFAFSYLESLIPFNFGIPGIKLGIANLVVIVALYTMNAKDALFISIIRILLSGLAFSGPFAMIYSLIGGLLSFLVMFVAKRVINFHQSVYLLSAEQSTILVKYSLPPLLCEHTELFIISRY